MDTEVKVHRYTFRKDILFWIYVKIRYENVSFHISIVQLLLTISKAVADIDLHLTKIITVHPIFWQLVRKIKTRNQCFLFYTEEESLFQQDALFLK